MLRKIVSLCVLGIASLIGGGGNPLMADGATIQVIEKEEKATSLDSFTSNIEGAKSALKKWAKANKDIMRQFDLFLQSLQKGIDEKVLTKEKSEKVLKAVAFAAEKHKLQMRTNPQKTPYIIHPLGVADQVMRIGHVYDTDVLIAALLHDVLDDTGTTREEIASQFGEKVASYVEEMTEDLKLSSKERKKLQIIHALHQSQGASFIKLSDKLHNLNTLMTDPPAGWSQDQMDQYFQWTQSVIENLPEVSDSLKEAVHKAIVKYWTSQEKK